jgi:hypothetical protein
MDAPGGAAYRTLLVRLARRLLFSVNSIDFFLQMAAQGAKNTVENMGRGPPYRDAKGHLRGGNPGNSGGKKGRSGRPSSEFRAFCRATITDPAVQRGIRRRAKTGDPALIRILAEHGLETPEPLALPPVPLRLDLLTVDQLTQLEDLLTIAAGENDRGLRPVSGDDSPAMYLLPPAVDPRMSG